MFVRSKVVKGHTYYQLVEGYRDGAGRVRHRTVASLGREPTIRDAIAYAERRLAAAKEIRAIWDGVDPEYDEVKRCDRKVAESRARVERLRSLLPPDPAERSAEPAPTAVQLGPVASAAKLLTRNGEPVAVEGIARILANVPGFSEELIGRALASLKASGHV